MAMEERALKEGERILAPTRRPDGTLRKPVRIRAGFTPQDEVPVYQSKGSQFRSGMAQVPPGFDPAEFAASKAKTKAAKKNEKRKEKKQQRSAGVSSCEPGGVAGDGDGGHGAAEVVAEQLEAMTIAAPSSAEQQVVGSLDVDKRIRALKKKIRLGETAQASMSKEGGRTAEQMEKLSKLNDWRMELQDLEKQFGQQEGQQTIRQ